MNSVSRPGSNFKTVGRGRGGHQSLGRGGQSQTGMPSSSERQDGHMRNRDSYYGSSGHAGTPPQQHVSYPYADSTNTNWRAHSGNNSRNYTRNNQTPPTPESPSLPQPQYTDDETVKFVADAWHEVDYEYRHPREGFNAPVYYQDKTPVNRNRPEFEPFDLDAWHAKRVQRY